MFKKLQIAATLLCMLSYATAGTVSIGTIDARGDMRIDNNRVSGNGTVFNGSVVETGEASANLRLNKGVEVKMATQSRGTVYSDHLVLQQGVSEVTGSNEFQLEAIGLRVTPNEPHSRGVVSVKDAKTVEVSALNGSFGVRDEQGIVLANILPGHALSFAMQAGANASEFSGSGVVSLENGTYYLTTVAGGKYILTCKDVHKYVNDKIVVSGTLQATGASSMLCAKAIEINGSNGGLTTGGKWLIAGAAVAAGAGIGIALANKASR